MRMGLSIREFGTKALTYGLEHGIIVALTHNVKVCHALPHIPFSEKSA